MSRIGLVTLADRSPSALSERRRDWIGDRHRVMTILLRDEGHEVVSPSLAESLASADDVPEIVKQMDPPSLDALVMLIPHWADPRVAAEMVHALDLPTALFAEDDPDWGGAQGMLRCSEAVRAAAGKWGRLAPRFIGQHDELLSWVRAMAVRGEVRRGAVLLWGGPRAGDEDRVTVFRGRTVGEIYAEDLAKLNTRADELEGKRHAKGMIKWMVKSGLEINHDREIFTPDIWSHQIAQLDAARERLAEIGGGHRILAVSVNGHRPDSPGPEETFGPLLAMLPFGEGPEGPTPVVPTTGDGDVSTLLGAAMLGRLGLRRPPLFGDIAHVSEGAVIVSHPGGMALWWAAQEHDPTRAFRRVTVQPECLGKRGGSWGYLGIEMDTVTCVQVGQRAGAPAVAVGLARPQLLRAADRQGITWGAPWPVVKMGGNFEPRAFAERAVSDHLLALPGVWVNEVIAWAEAEGFDVLELGPFTPWAPRR